MARGVYISYNCVKLCDAPQPAENMIKIGIDRLIISFRPKIWPSFANMTSIPGLKVSKYEARCEVCPSIPT